MEKKIEKKYVDEIIDTLGIRTKLENLPSALSGGQQQRVAIARALAAKPAILLADEPTGNLDSKTSQDVLGLLKVTSKRFHQTIVMITHNEEIAQLADTIIRIEDGKSQKAGGSNEDGSEQQWGCDKTDCKEKPCGQQNQKYIHLSYHSHGSGPGTHLCIISFWKFKAAA